MNYDTDESEELAKNLSEKSTSIFNSKTADSMKKNASFSMIADKDIHGKSSFDSVIRNSLPVKKTSAVAIPLKSKRNTLCDNLDSDSDDDDIIGRLDSSYDSNDSDDFNQSIERMITSETPPDPFITIQTRTRLKWVDDGNAPICGGCGATFRLFLRRHHCRLCGNIFCSSCSDNWDVIPECITHIPSTNGIKGDINRHAKVRLCNKCDEKITLVKKLEILLTSIQSINMDIFAIKAIGEQKSGDLTDSFIQKINDIPDMNDMDNSEIIKFTKNFMNGKLWKQLANFYLSKFREIQYKLSYQDYTEWEKTALWTNYTHLKGHDIWMVHVIRAFSDDLGRLEQIIDYYFSDTKTDDPVMVKDRDDCWERMCTRLCQPKISWENGLILLDIVTNMKTDDIINIEIDSESVRNKITSEIIRSFRGCSDIVLESILPTITYNIIHGDINELLIVFVMEKCCHSVRVSNSLYWSLMVEKPNNRKRCDYLISRLFREIPREIYDLITEVNNFVRTIEDNYVGDKNPKEPIANLDSIKECVSPTEPEVCKRNVIPKILPGEKSANRPVPILLEPLEKHLIPEGYESVDLMLYKREDLRTDLVVMSIINIMKEIVEENMDIDLHVVTYNIQPIDENSGFIGAVPNCKTLYHIEEKIGVSIANYIRKMNPDCTTKELSERFIHSCAFYSVITFLLGIGDRHLDNIMVKDSGEIFHIDFGFILGKDPRPMKTPYMRITEGMLDAIGGYGTEDYLHFKELCYNIYDVLRRHVNTFVCLLSLLPKQNTGGTWTNPKISDNRVLREIVKRFAPGETYTRARSLLHTRIDKSTNMTSISKYHVVDFFHRHNKEGTIQNVLSYTMGNTLTGTRNVVQGIWDYVSGSIS